MKKIAVIARQEGVGASLFTISVENMKKVMEMIHAEKFFTPLAGDDQDKLQKKKITTLDGFWELQNVSWIPRTRCSTRVQIRLQEVSFECENPAILLETNRSKEQLQALEEIKVRLGLGL